MFRLWLCSWLWWHDWELERRLSGVATLWRCSCGRKYAVNHDVRGVLPWTDELRNLYAERERLEAS